MATHSSTPSWRIPWTEEPGRLQSMGSQSDTTERLQFTSLLQVFAAKDRRQEEKGTTEDEMVGWHHRLNAHEFKPTPGVGDGQGGLVCCSP